LSEVVAGRVDEIPDGSVIVIRRPPYGIGVFNVRGSFYAVLNYCIHQGARVCAGWITGTTESPDGYRSDWVREGEILRCPWHLWEYDIATGRALHDTRKGLKTYPVRVEDGKVIVQISERPSKTGRPVSELSDDVSESIPDE
jgi:nitrite reductase/ring-hydroxylating ferredoxin subunit